MTLTNKLQVFNYSETIQNKQKKNYLNIEQTASANYTEID